MRALVLDFDGLVMDTETSAFESWRVVYERYDVPLSRAEWLEGIGSDRVFANPAERLSRATGRPVAELRAARREVRDAMIEGLEPLPGVRQWLDQASALGLRVAIASSSPRSWVVGHLERVGLLERFEALANAEDVPVVKPDPAVYRVAMERLAAGPGEALAVEDSVHGLKAAREAGLPCVAVPCSMTAGMDFAGAHVVLGSLAERSLAEVLEGLRGAR